MGIKLADPSQRVVAVCGDGAFHAGPGFSAAPRIDRPTRPRAVMTASAKPSAGAERAGRDPPSRLRPRSRNDSP
ncbi:hypothetical protein ITP53_01390 [Nonomuraea sp. K274]|uniref:Uncharacterized protein n=2 Tax=Nonomuraea cypriaca TaxID=1187855 RepID=A0A931A6T8_9ACTN|nr:hypothetical protein [Nonomuraea cypriaca]